MYRFGFEISFIRSYKDLIGFSEKTAPSNDRRGETQMRQVEGRLVRQQLLFELSDFQILFRMHSDATGFGRLNVDTRPTGRSHFGCRRREHACAWLYSGSDNNLWNQRLIQR